MTAATPKTLRARAFTAAERSLKLIADAAAADLATLKNKDVPSGSFAASVRKYEAALERLQVLHELADGTEGDVPDEVLVQRDDLSLLTQALQAVIPEFVAAHGDNPDGPLGRIFQALDISPGQQAVPAAVPAPAIPAEVP